LYITSDDFVREVYGSLIKNDQSIELLKEKYAQVDLLLFDDVEFLSKKEKINEILFYIFNKNINENKIIIFTSDSTPSELNNFDDRMISRFNSGLCVILQTPSNEDIKNLFLKKIASVNKDINFTEEAIAYVIHRYSKDVRQLEGFIQNLLF
jgi:chromosomal replication initiator protein